MGNLRTRRWRINPRLRLQKIQRPQSSPESPSMKTHRYIKNFFYCDLSPSRLKFSAFPSFQSQNIKPKDCNLKMPIIFIFLFAWIYNYYYVLKLYDEWKTFHRCFINFIAKRLLFFYANDKKGKQVQNGADDLQLNRKQTFKMKVDPISRRNWLRKNWKY